jgi:hypothetical protein
VTNTTNTNPDPLKPQQKVLIPGQPGSNIQFGNQAAEVVIHDSSGNVVFEQNNNGSFSTIVWDGRDFNGSSVSSGVYLCKIKGMDGRIVYAPIVIVK